LTSNFHHQLPLKLKTWIGQLFLMFTMKVFNKTLKKKVDASLPLLSFMAGFMTATEIIKLLLLGMHKQIQRNNFNSIVTGFHQGETSRQMK